MCSNAARPLLVLLPLIIVSCASTPPPAGEEPLEGRYDDPRSLEEIVEEMDGLMGPIVEQGWIKGATIAFIHPAGTEVESYGVVEEGGPAPALDTVFEIGSVAKVFTAMLLHRMVAAGELEMHTPVAELLPEGFEVPSYEGREIRLVDLATHQSGLPRMPDNFAPADPENPYADYSAELLAAFLAGHELRYEPGTKAEYSNLGMGLLGFALASHAGTSYEELVKEWVLLPLGMNDTSITLSEDQQERFAQGHDADGRQVAPWDVPVLAGAGALRSTTSDMLRFLQASMGLMDAPLDGTIARSQQMRGPFDESNTIGLGWLISANGIRWHNGQTGGYHAFVASSRGEGVGVVVLSNTGSQQVTAVGGALMRMLRGRPYSIELPQVAEVPEEVLQRYVGRYELAPGMIFTITLEEGSLFAQLTGQPALEIHPVSETEFIYRAVPARIVFRVGDEGEVQGLVLQQGGQDMFARRLEDEPEEPESEQQQDEPAGEPAQPEQQPGEPNAEPEAEPGDEP